MLEKSYEDLEALDIRLMLTGLHATVQDMLDRSGVTEKIGAENYYSTVLDALLAVAQENIDDLTADEVASIFNEIDTLTEIVSAASERANEGDRATLDAVLEKLGEIQDHPEAQ
jgi:hypothetical protein